MHICFITHEYPKEGFANGGIGSFIKTLAGGLVKSGIEVSVVGHNQSSHSEYTDDAGVAVHRIGKASVKGFSWLINAIRLNEKIASIHSKSPISVIEASELGLAFIKKIPAIKYVIRLHGGHHFFAEAENRGINKWKGFQERRSFAKADHFVAVSKYVEFHTGKYLSFHRKPVTRIPSPIDTNFFKPLNIQPVAHRIVFAGTVCEKKGIRQLIQAFPKILDSFPDATLQVFGRDWKFPGGGSYMEYLKKEELTKIGASANRIVFHGAVNRLQLREAYASAAVCVFPSHMETQGLVAPEAMAMGKVVVFTKLGPGPETIVPYETGLLCDPHDPEDIAEKVCWVFKNPGKVPAISTSAANQGKVKFGIEHITQKNLNFYQKII